MNNIVETWLKSWADKLNNKLIEIPDGIQFSMTGFDVKIIRLWQGYESYNYSITNLKTKENFIVSGNELKRVLYRWLGY